MTFSVTTPPLFPDRESGVLGLLLAARVLWPLGYPDQARQKSEAACTLAQELSYPFPLAAAWSLAALSHQLRRDTSLTHEWAAAAITLARGHGFPTWLGLGLSCRAGSPNRDRVKRGLARSAKAWPPVKP